MIPKIICFIFGHRLSVPTNFHSDPDTDLIISKQKPMAVCTRCGKYLGKWWLPEKETNDES